MDSDSQRSQASSGNPQGEEHFADIIMDESDFMEMPELEEVSDSDFEGEGDYEMNANHTDDFDIIRTSFLPLPPSSEFPSPSPATSSVGTPQRSNRRARVEDDEDEVRDRRHPSQRTSSASGTPSSSTLPPPTGHRHNLPHFNVPTPAAGTNPAPPSHPHPIPLFTHFTGLGTANPSIPDDINILFGGFLQQTRNTGIVNAANITQPPAVVPGAQVPQQPPQPDRNGPNTTPDGMPHPMVEGFSLSLVMDASGLPQMIPRQPQQGAHEATAANGQQQPQPAAGAAAARRPNLSIPQAFADGIPIAQAGTINFGNFGHIAAIFGMGGSHHADEKEDPKRAKKLVDGLEEVPDGLIKRLERVGGGGGMGEEDESRGVGDAGCAVCWDRLLPEASEQSEDNDAKGKVDERKTIEPKKADGAAEEETKVESKHPKIVSLPCAHVFHADCLIPWFSRPGHTTCPTCRFNIDPEDLTYVSARRRRREEQEREAARRRAEGGDAQSQDGQASAESPIPTSANGTTIATPTLAAEAPNPAAAAANNFANLLQTLSGGAVPGQTQTQEPTPVTGDAPPAPAPTPGQPTAAAQPQRGVAPPFFQRFYPAAGNAQGNPRHQSTLRPLAHDSIYSSPLMTSVAFPSLNTGLPPFNVGDAPWRVFIDETFRINLSNPTNPAPTAPAAGNTNAIDVDNTAPPAAPASDPQGPQLPQPQPQQAQQFGSNADFLRFTVDMMFDVPPAAIGTEDEGDENDAIPDLEIEDEDDGEDLPEALGSDSDRNARDAATNLNANPNLDPMGFAAADAQPLQGQEQHQHPPVPQTQYQPQPHQPAQPHPFQQPQPGTQVPPTNFPPGGLPMGGFHLASGSGQSVGEALQQLFANFQQTPPAPQGPATAAPPGAAPTSPPTTTPAGQPQAAAAQPQPGAPTQPQVRRTGGVFMMPPQMLFGGAIPHRRQPERPKKAWALPPAPGPTLRQRIERREREAGLRCHDISCGLGPSDEDPFGTELSETLSKAQQLSIKKKMEDAEGDKTSVCEHRFHSACLVSAERVAWRGADAVVEDGGVEVSCPVCRGVGCVTKEEWDEGVLALQ